MDLLRMFFTGAIRRIWLGSALALVLADSGIGRAAELPVLALTPSATSFSLSWPAVAINFGLEASSNPLQPSTWTPVTNPAALVNGVWLVTVPADPGNRFFRLAGVTSSLNTGLAAYWKLDEATGQIRKDSVNQSDLIENGSCTNIAGKIGNSVQTDYGHTLSCPDNDNLGVGGNQDFTICAWAKIRDNSFNGPIVNKHGSDFNKDCDYELWYDTLANRFRLTIGDGSRFDTQWNQSAPPLDVGNWHFVVTWYSHVDQKIYIQTDNGPIDYGNHTTGTIRTAGPFEVGGYRVNNEGFRGAIDEVGLWKRVLTADERTQLYNLGAGRTCCPF